jgi:tryptophan-rich sensory protein
MKNYLKLIISILIPLVIGFIGSFFTTSAISSWYAGLNKPVFNPPNWIFGPVWTLLYIMIGVSIYLVWINKEKKKGMKKKAFWIFGIQLFLNFIWSILFFGNHLISFAFVDIILLWIAIIFNMYFCYKISKISSCLLFPYLLWVSFASVLNFAILILN